MMEASPFSSHHRPLLPPPFFLSPSRLASSTPSHAPLPLPQRLYRPAPTSESFKLTTPSYSHSIARLAGIQTELEEKERDSKEERMEDLVDSSDSDTAKIMYHDTKKTGYKINRKMEKDILKDDTDLKKVDPKTIIKTAQKNFFTQKNLALLIRC